MKIYLISQDENNCYDTYDSAVVIAENEEQARNMIPYEKGEHNFDRKDEYDEWTEPKYVKVEYIGEADKKYTKPYQVCVSYNAG